MPAEQRKAAEAEAKRILEAEQEAGVESDGDGLQLNRNGLQPTSDGLQPNCDGSDKSRWCFVWTLQLEVSSTRSIMVSLQSMQRQ